MKRTFFPTAESQEKSRAKGCLYTSYTLAILLGLVFLAANVGMAAYAVSTMSWGWLLVFAVLIIPHVATPFLPDLFYKAYGERRLTLRMATRLGLILLLLWSFNLLLILLYASALWTL